MIGVMLLTYERTDYALETLEGLNSYLRTSEPVHLHIADDGSRQEHWEKVLNYAQRLTWVARLTTSNSGRQGYGANYNLGTQAIHQDCDIILPLEDDWRLVRDLRLDPLAAMLRNDPRVSCIRLGYIGWTQPLRGEFFASQGQTLLLLDPDSPEPHVFAGHPRLETREYERRVGPWPTGLRAGETEFAITHRAAARQGVVWPADLIHPRGDLFAHIGTISSEAIRADREGAAPA